MADVLIDTDVFMNHLRGIGRLRPGRSRICYSVITRLELLASRGADEEVIRRLLAPFTEICLDREMAEAAGRIRREFGIRLRDALIAATALSRGASVLTLQLRHFDRVRGLRVQSPS
jgi:predicted nucleic acid-binding protein